jgi:CheY-like chemotaxis protein
MPGDASPRSVLLVDDDREACLLLGALIRLLRPMTTVLTAYGGEEGVALALGQRPSGVVLDLEMPGLNGEGAAARIRTVLGHSTCVLVAVSGSPERLGQPANGALFDRCFLKPVPIDALLAALDL